MARRAVVAMALTSRFPIVLWLGDELRLVYNDDYAPLLGEKHPSALGRTGSEVWAEIWDPIGPMLAGVVSTGVATWSSDLMLPLITGGRPEERYFTFTYSPLVEQDGSVGGVFCAVTETTDRVLGERRLETLTALGSAVIDAASAQEVVTAAAAVLTGRPADVPFFATYLADHDTDRPDPPLFGASQPVASVLRRDAPRLSSWGVGVVPAGEVVVDDLAGRFGPLRSLLGAGCPESAVVLPVGEMRKESAIGAMVIGLNPLRPLDVGYTRFCRLIADQVSGALAVVGAYQHERGRAEALAQLDGAKTAFLTNVSHEFRTPLTLMLGPLEDALSEASDDESARERLEMIHRNGVRLLRMVNSLLDFARLEAGQSEPHRVVIDLGTRTREVTSSFAELCAQSGVELRLETSPVLAQVDEDMWETIVLNLLSNAFKFTLDGSITVRVAPAGDEEVEVVVADTGTGIAANDVARIFERFYRPLSTRGRSTEGSGIGLALVKSLVECQGGTIDLDSSLGTGTRVIIRLPAIGSGGDTGIDGVRLESPSENLYLAEARQWLREEDRGEGQRSIQGVRPVIVVADDNRDMRRQLDRILGDRFEVILTGDGEGALAAIRRARPDLVVTDVMMPTLDGFGLVAAIRSDPALSELPVIMLSARAGPDAGSEGLKSGADDYIVKPFRAADLINRVTARLGASGRADSSRQAEQLQAQKSKALSELGAALAAAPSVGDVLSALAAAPLGSLVIEGVCLGLLDGQSHLVRCDYAGSVDPILADRYHLMSQDDPLPIAEVVRNGDSLVITDRSALEDRYGDEGRRIGANVTVALRGDDGTVIGAVGLLWRRAMQFSADDVDTIEKVASLVARAAERLKATEAEHQLAVHLQDRLLRVDLLSSAAAVCAVYEPASEQMRIGGDWYTTLALDDHRLGISVGDVVGHGLQAAVTMSQLRSGFESAALSEDDPDTVVSTLDRYAAMIPGALCSTLAYAVLDSDARTVTYSSAGHPYPLLVLPDGTVGYLQDGHRPTLATASSRTATRSGRAELPAGSLVVLYTDGLIERRGQSLDVGFARLADVSAGLRYEPVGEVCAHLIEALQPTGGFSDDVALIAARPAGVATNSFVHVFPATVYEIGPLRRRLWQWLSTLALDESVVGDIVIGVGEAVNNAIEHGSGFDRHRRVSLEVFAAHGSISATVSDSGRWESDSTASHRTGGRGRGITLMHGVADEVRTVRSPLGTRVTLRYGTRPRQLAT
jgi:signal transduction histidine kinase/serine phosphatase RsbU (regulator of sigma subunit)/CheY-like chemotaxis protein